MRLLGYHDLKTCWGQAVRIRLQVPIVIARTSHCATRRDRPLSGRV